MYVWRLPWLQGPDNLSESQHERDEDRPKHDQAWLRHPLDDTPGLRGLMYAAAARPASRTHAPPEVARYGVEDGTFEALPERVLARFEALGPIERMDLADVVPLFQAASS